MDDTARARTSGMKWGRVVAAGVGAHLVDDVIFAVLPFLGWLAGGWWAGVVGGLFTATLTALLAYLVGRSVGSSTALRHGTAVGAVAGALAFLFGLPSLWAPMYGAVTAAAGVLGGLAGNPSRPELEERGTHYYSS